VTATKLPVVARLRLPDGREFDVHTETEEQHAAGEWYYWTEGNNGCDCNRMLYIEREHGIDLIPPDADYRCGDTIELVSLTVGGRDAEQLDRESNR
jgi:hypothetical protein